MSDYSKDESILALITQGAVKAIEDIRFVSSKTAKEGIIRNQRDNPVLKRILRMTYDPGLVYGMKALPSFTPGGGDMIDDSTFAILEKMASGELSGRNAEVAVSDELSRLDLTHGEIFGCIIRKDLRGGFGASTVNKAIPDLIPEYPYMRCSLPDKSNMSKWDWTKGVYSQEKADGMFANLSLLGHSSSSNRDRLTSREGSSFPILKFDKLMTAARVLLAEGYQYHGELLVEEDGGILPREESNGVLNRVLKGGDFAHNQQPIFVIWDFQPCVISKSSNVKLVEGDDKYRERFEDLQAMLGAATSLVLRLIPSVLVFSEYEAKMHYKKMLLAGREGTVLKHADAIWKDGTSKDQVKFKLEVDVELEVHDFIEGEGKYVGTLGALVCRSGCGKLEVNVNGRTDAMRDEVWANRLDWLGSIVTVRANAIMFPSKSNEMYSLFLPRFIEQRNDKMEANDVDEIQSHFDNAVTTA